VLEFVGDPQFRKVGAAWKLDARIKIFHECELTGRPRVEA
jgi:hypothetical protein